MAVFLKLISSLRFVPIQRVIFGTVFLAFLTVNAAVSADIKLGPVTPETQETMIGLEHRDRIERIRRLSAKFNAMAPAISGDLQIEAGTIENVDYAVPVIWLVYDNKTFFDFDSDRARSDSLKVLDVLAEQMKRDMPDVHLLVVGHTDSTGSFEYNNDLSLRRAWSVMRQLALRGVRAGQISAAAIGERQPAATNATSEGRAKNRRVEFLLGAFSEATYAVLEHRNVNINWLNNHPAPDEFEERKSSIDVSVPVVQLKGDVSGVSAPEGTRQAKAREAEVLAIPLIKVRTVTLRNPSDPI